MRRRFAVCVGRRMCCPLCLRGGRAGLLVAAPWCICVEEDGKGTVNENLDYTNSGYHLRNWRSSNKTGSKVERENAVGVGMKCCRQRVWSTGSQTRTHMGGERDGPHAQNRVARSRVSVFNCGLSWLVRAVRQRRLAWAGVRPGSSSDRPKNIHDAIGRPWRAADSSSTSICAAHRTTLHLFTRRVGISRLSRFIAVKALRSHHPRGLVARRRLHLHTPQWPTTRENPLPRARPRPRGHGVLRT